MTDDQDSPKLLAFNHAMKEQLRARIEAKRVEAGRARDKMVRSLRDAIEEEINTDAYPDLIRRSWYGGDNSVTVETHDFRLYTITVTAQK